jgi:hypothetical protein|tara:strand:+ start:265 stop:549 length:285 start_codon:yes stop_codon:yes gene_type:complete
MNRRLSKRVSKKALEISVEWLKSLLSDAEAAKVNAKHIPRDNPYTFKNGTAFSIPYSYRGAKAIIKKILTRKQLPLDLITIHDIEKAIKGTPRS